MNFAYTIQYVPNVAEAVAFYEQCFGLAARFVHESGQYAELETAGVTLAFTAEALARQNLGDAFALSKPADTSFGVEIAFSTEDVDKAYRQAIKHGATSVLEPAQKPWGQTVAYVKDLNGFLVELCTPMS